MFSLRESHIDINHLVNGIKIIKDFYAFDSMVKTIYAHTQTLYKYKHADGKRESKKDLFVLWHFDVIPLL